MLNIISIVALFFLIISTVSGKGGYFSNASLTTIPGIAENRASLTFDWLASEDLRQRELVFHDTDAPVQVSSLSFVTRSTMLASECVSYEKPAPGKVARLMLELLKNLEGDEGTIIPDLIQALVRSKLLIETSILEEEPDLDSLVKTPGIMMGAPHATLPRVLALVWMSATDPGSTKRTGWCNLNKITKYLTTSRAQYIASHMRTLDLVVARARFIMDEFIQHVTPNMYDRSQLLHNKNPKLPVAATRAKKTRPSISPETLNQSTTLPTLVPTSFELITSEYSRDVQIDKAQFRAREAHNTASDLESLFLLVVVTVFVINFLV